jgi:PKD repeat protein
VSFEVATTADEVTDQFYPIWFSRAFLETFMFLADMQTTNGNDNATVRWQNRDTYRIEVKIEEEQSGDSETGHNTEVVGYMAFGLTEPWVTPVADFSGAPTSGQAPLSVTFTDESTGTVTGWSWDFGDGSTSTEQNPTHTYTDSRTYTVSLTVTGPEGSDDEIKTDFITVNEPGPGPSMEVGEVSVDYNWTRVDLSRSFLDPVVVAKPLSYNGVEPAVVRMRDVDGRGFETRVQEWDYLNQTHTLETVSYLVMERGSHVLDDGTQVEAGSFVTDQTSSSSFTTVSFSQPFEGQVPVVVAAVGSFNGTDTVTNRLRNIGTAGFEFRMQEQEKADQEHSTETIYYIAWQPGLGTVNGVSFEVATTADEVTDQFYPIWFSGAFLETPMFLADMQTTNGNDNATVRWQNRDTYRIEVKIEEEQSRDRETGHKNEVVGYMVFSVEN